MKVFSINAIIALALSLLTGCVQNTHLKTIRFEVDASHLKNVSKIGIRGGEKPLSWDDTYFMSDDDGDGIFELTLEFKTASPSIEFKFVNQDNQFELHDRDNRQLPFKYKPEALLYKTKFNNPENTITLK